MHICRRLVITPRTRALLSRHRHKFRTWRYASWISVPFQSQDNSVKFSPWKWRGCAKNCVCTSPSLAKSKNRCWRVGISRHSHNLQWTHLLWARGGEVSAPDTSSWRPRGTCGNPPSLHVSCRPVPAQHKQTEVGQLYPKWMNRHDEQKRIILMADLWSLRLAESIFLLEDLGVFLQVFLDGLVNSEK